MELNVEIFNTQCHLIRLESELKFQVRSIVLQKFY